MPKQSREFFNHKILRSNWPNETTHLIKGPNYGLIGYLIGINFVVIRPESNSSHDIITFLRSVDAMPNSRQPLEEFERFTGMKLVLSTTGAEGLKLHQKFAATLPTREFVIDTAINHSRKKLIDLFEQYPDLPREDAISKLDSEIEKLIKNILALVLLGSEPTQDHITVLHHAFDGNTRITEQYQAWVRTTINAVLLKQSRGGSALEKAIAQIENPDLDTLVEDPTINALFTALLTFMNLAQLINLAICKCIEQPELEKELTDEFTALSATPLHFDKNCLSAPSLKKLFKDALLSTSFTPNYLPRLISQPIEYQNQMIASGTTLFVKHLHAKAPFSYGERRCPGNRLVEYIFEAVVAVSVDFFSKRCPVKDTCKKTECSNEFCF